MRDYYTHKMRIGGNVFDCCAQKKILGAKIITVKMEHSIKGLKAKQKKTDQKAGIKEDKKNQKIILGFKSLNIQNSRKKSQRRWRGEK